MEGLTKVLQRSNPDPNKDVESHFNVPLCDYSSWASSRDMFTAVYGRNSKLSDVENCST